MPTRRTAFVFCEKPIERCVGGDYLGGRIYRNHRDLRQKVRVLYLQLGCRMIKGDIPHGKNE